MQGILPRHQQEMAAGIGKIVNREFSFTSLEKKVIDPQNFEKLKPEIEGHIDHFLSHKIKEVFPMLSMFIGDKTITQLKSAFINELETLFPVLMKAYLGQLQQNINIEKMVADKILAISPGQLEQLLFSNAKKPLRQLQLFGAAIGFAIGCIQALILFLLQ